MTSSVRVYSNEHAFHYKLQELGNKPKGSDFQYLPNTGDINTVKAGGRILKFLGWTKPGTEDQARSIDAIGKLIAKHVLFLNKEVDVDSLQGLKNQIEQLHLTEHPLYGDLDRILKIVEQDTSPSNSIWDLIPKEIQLRLLSHLTPEEISATAKVDREFARRIRDPLVQAANKMSSKPLRPKIDFDENLQNINLDVLRSVNYPLLEIPTIKANVEKVANNIKAYYNSSGKSKPEQVDPKFAGFEWIDLALLEMKIRGQPLFEATP